MGNGINNFGNSNQDQSFPLLMLLFTKRPCPKNPSAMSIWHSVYGWVSAASLSQLSAKWQDMKESLFSVIFVHDTMLGNYYLKKKKKKTSGVGLYLTFKKWPYFTFSFCLGHYLFVLHPIYFFHFLKSLPFHFN